MGELVGILVDAENVASWGAGVLSALLTRAAAEGNVLYRRAYADWTNGASRLAPELSRLGFELVHVHHPAARKNSADIHMTVDAMDLYALEPELRTFVLATGDSDFAPLFRRLRERGCRVIGAGPRSALSEAVASSCVDFIYIDPARTKATSPKAPPKPAPARTSAQPPSKPTPAPVSAEPAAPPASPAKPEDEAPPAAAPGWRTIVRDWRWRPVTAEALQAAHTELVAYGSATRAAHVVNLEARLGDGTLARKALGLLYKTGLLCSCGAEGEFKVDKAEQPLADLVDAAFLTRVHTAITERGLVWDDLLLDSLIGARDPERVARLRRRGPAGTEWPGTEAAPPAEVLPPA